MSTITPATKPRTPQAHAVTSSWDGETCSCTCGTESAQKTTADVVHAHRVQAAEAAFAQLSTADAAAMVQLNAQGGDYTRRLAMGILIADDPVAGVPNWVAGEFRLRPYTVAFYDRSGALWAGLVWANVLQALDAGELSDVEPHWCADWTEQILRVALSVAGEGAVTLHDLKYMRRNPGLRAALTTLTEER